MKGNTLPATAKTAPRRRWWKIAAGVIGLAILVLLAILPLFTVGSPIISVLMSRTSNAQQVVAYLCEHIVLSQNMSYLKDGDFVEALSTYYQLGRGNTWQYQSEIT